MDSENTEFLRKYEISVLNEKRGYRTRFPEYFTDPKDANYISTTSYNYKDYYVNNTAKFNYEKIMVIQLPETALNRLAQLDRQFSSHISPSGSDRAFEILDRDWNAKVIRLKNPAVQAAWEQYSLLLHLASNGQPLP